MPVQGKRVLLAGIEHQLATDLARHLSARGLEVHRAETLEATNKQPSYDLVFCETRQPGLQELLRSIETPVVVVSRVPEVNEWLDAMDAGATDYCAAPFEREQLDWILESNLGRLEAALSAA